MLKTNILYMTLSQIANYLFPLILVPYLISVLGLNLYGIYIVFQTILFFGLLITNYSYNITGVKRVSQNAYDHQKTILIFNDIYTTKIVLFFLVYTTFALLPFIITRLEDYRIEFFFIMLNVVGYALFPDWFLQGIGKFKTLMMLNIIYKFIQFFLIILFIHSKSDFLLLNIIYGLTPIFMALHALFILKIKKLIFKKENIINELKKHFRIFLSLLFRNSNSSFIILYIGLNFQLEIVAVIGSLDKIVKAVRSLFDPIFNVVFQYLNQKNKSIDKFLLIDKMVKFAILFSLVFILSFNIFKEEISIFLFKHYDPTYTPIFFLFSIMPMLLILTNIFGIQTMITYNYEKKYNDIMFLSFVLTICFVLIFKDNIYFLLGSLPTVEGFILIYTYIYYKRIKNANYINS